MESNLKIVEWNIDKLISAEYNPRKLSEEQKQKIKDSISRFGLVDPVIVNTNKERFGIIIGGHQRTKVSREMGFKKMPCVELDLNLEQEKELNVRLNKNTGEFDKELLVEYFDQDDLVDWGFDNEYFEDVVTEIDAPEEDDFNGELPTEPKTVLGDLYELNGHRVHCASSTEIDAVEKLMDGKKSDMVFTDPPYGVDYEGINNDDRGGLEDLLRSVFSNKMIHTKKGGSFYCFHSDKCSDIFSKVYREFCHFSSMIIWVKESIVLSQTDYQSKHEPCMYGWFDNGTHKWYSDRKQTSVWNTKAERIEGHTTPKPIEIVSNAIKNSSLKNHVIIDFFLGSGSTLIASEQLDRKCYGQELDPKYCDVIVKRWVKYMTDNNRKFTIKRNGEDITKETWINE